MNFIKKYYRKIPLVKRLKLLFFLRYLKGVVYQNNLTKLALIHKTDKFGNHKYTPHYQKHFKQYRYKKIKLLEIGVGGYDNPLSGGNSLRMWKNYFPFGKIFSIDIVDKSFHEVKRIKIFKGSQIDEIFLESVLLETGELDIIIDDGSHINEQVIKSFQIFFPKLKTGGIYVIEDTQTSYWETYGGSSKNLNQKGTIYHFFKNLIDSLNWQEFVIDDYQASYYDRNIISIHFYHNLIFIHKGDNNEGSNYLVNNRLPYVKVSK